VVFHLLHIVFASLLSSVCPIESLPFALSLAALMTSGAYLVLRLRLRIDALGVAVAPLSLTFLVGAQFVGLGAASHRLPGVLLALHITANVLGVGLFILAGLAGAFYLIQENRLKQKKHLGKVGRLPALDALDTTEHRLLLLGFPLLTFGAVSGGVFLAEIAQMSFEAVLRVVLGYGTWLLVAIVLVSRAALGWRGRRSAYGTLAGLAGVLALVMFYVLRDGGGA
jgi:ABC-type uncharacterized transport system permease subunit